MKADELMKKYKRKHGNSWNFSCQMESVDENKRTFYSAEYLDVGLLRQVHTRNNLHHVYYESSCGTFGRYSALKLKRIKTINQLQLEFPQFLINKETFDFKNGIIKDGLQFYSKDVFIPFPENIPKIMSRNSKTSRSFKKIQIKEEKET